MAQAVSTPRTATRTVARRKSLGQGMTEYIVIVALVGVAAIGVYSFLGQSVRGATAGIALELAGERQRQGGQCRQGQGHAQQLQQQQPLMAGSAASVIRSFHASDAAPTWVGAASGRTDTLYPSKPPPCGHRLRIVRQLAWSMM